MSNEQTSDAVERVSKQYALWPEMTDAQIETALRKYIGFWITPKPDGPRSQVAGDPATIKTCIEALAIHTKSAYRFPQRDYGEKRAAIKQTLLKRTALTEDSIEKIIDQVIQGMK